MHFESDLVRARLDKKRHNRKQFHQRAQPARATPSIGTSTHVDITVNSDTDLATQSTSEIHSNNSRQQPPTSALLKRHHRDKWRHLFHPR